MRHIIFACLLLLMAATSDAQHEHAKSLMIAWEKSWNTYDLDEVQRLFVNDSSVTYFSSERAGLIHGIDSLVKHHKGFGFVPGGKTSPNKLWLSGIRYLPAAVTATWHFQKPGNPEQRGPVTFILHRDAKGLRIAHAHFSNDPKAR